MIIVFRTKDGVYDGRPIQATVNKGFKIKSLSSDIRIELKKSILHSPNDCEIFGSEEEMLQLAKDILGCCESFEAAVIKARIKE